MKAVHRRLLVLGVFALVLGILVYRFGLPNFLTLKYIQQRSVYLEACVAHNYWLSVFIYLISCTLAVVFGLPIIGLFAMVAGFLFGLWPGLFYTVIASLAGSLIYVEVARHLLKRILEGRYMTQLARFNKRVSQYGHSYLVALHFSTVLPFFLINSLAALANVPIYTVAWTTVVGSIPSLFLYSLAGRKLSVMTSARDLFTPDVVLLLIVLAILALMPTIVKQIQKRVEACEE